MRQQARENKVRFDRYSQFTVVSYYWVLDAANKAEIMKNEQKILQRLEQIHQNPMDMVGLLFHQNDP